MKLAYVGDARNNMGNSLLIGCAKMGIDFTAVAPRELFPDPSLLEEMQEVAARSGAVIELSEDIPRGVAGADAIYTDVWVSMGEEEQFARRIALLKDYQVTSEMLEMTGNPDVLFLHCLPSFHDLNTETGRAVHQEFGLDAMRSATRSLKAGIPWFLIRRKTGCTPSKRSWPPASGISSLDTGDFPRRGQSPLRA